MERESTLVQAKSTKPSKWNKQKQQVRGDSQESLIINNFLIEFRNKIYEKEIELMKRGYMINVPLLKDAILNKVESLKDKTLMQVISEHNSAKEKLIGKGISPSTYGIHAIVPHISSNRQRHGTEHLHQAFEVLESNHEHGHLQQLYPI